jgi:hypothetical protein
MAKHYGIRYGYDASGTEIQPRDGERILDEGDPLPEKYRPWLNGSGWLNPVKLHTHPGANTEARVFGNYWAFAVPTEARVPKVEHVEAKPPEAILDVPDVVSESPPELNIVDDVPSVPASQTPVKKRQKRKSLPVFTNQIMFDD